MRTTASRWSAGPAAAGRSRGSDTSSWSGPEFTLTNSPLAPRTIGIGILAGLGLVAAGLLIGLPLIAAAPLTVDDAIMSRIGTTDHPWAIGGARAIGYVGHLLVVVPVVVGLSIRARMRFGDWQLGLFLLVVLGGATAVTAVLKRITSRPRPDEAVASTFTSAFPSGHAVRAAAIYGLVAWLVWCLSRRWATRTLAIVGAVVLVLLNGGARIALAVHWPTDVLVGIALGGAWLAISIALVRPRLVAASDHAPGRARPG